jgi:hypothetical protein
MKYIGVAHQPRAAIVPAETAKSAILLRGDAWNIDIAARRFWLANAVNATDAAATSA